MFFDANNFAKYFCFIPDEKLQGSNYLEVTGRVYYKSSSTSDPLGVAVMRDSDAEQVKNLAVWKDNTAVIEAESLYKSDIPVLELNINYGNTFDTLARVSPGDYVDAVVFYDSDRSELRGIKGSHKKQGNIEDFLYSPKNRNKNEENSNTNDQTTKGSMNNSHLLYGLMFILLFFFYSF
jgi:hypothetical protein